MLAAYSLADRAAIVAIAAAAGGAGGVLIVAMSVDPAPDYGKAYAIGAAAGTVLGLVLTALPK